VIFITALSLQRRVLRGAWALAAINTRRAYFIAAMPRHGINDINEKSMVKISNGNGRDGISLWHSLGIK